MFVSISFLYTLDDSDSVGCHGYLNQVLFRFLGSQADDLKHKVNFVFEWGFM